MNDIKRQKQFNHIKKMSGPSKSSPNLGLIFGGGGLKHIFSNFFIHITGIQLSIFFSSNLLFWVACWVDIWGFLNKKIVKAMINSVLIGTLDSRLEWFSWL